MPSIHSDDRHSSREQAREQAFDDGGDLGAELREPVATDTGLRALLLDPKTTVELLSRLQIADLCKQGERQTKSPELAAACKKPNPDLEQILRLTREALQKQG